jgi:tetratricopeptide (TPR) repeat protein
VNEFLNQALLMKPDSEFFHFARGYIKEQMGKSDEAIQCYQKAIKLNPQYAEAYINLGLVYYNRGVSQLEMANAIPGNQTERYEIEKSKADAEFRKALPYFEKSHQLEGSNNTVLDLLKTLYYRLQMFDKHAAVLKILEDKQ